MITFIAHAEIKEIIEIFAEELNGHHFLQVYTKKLISQEMFTKSKLKIAFIDACIYFSNSGSVKIWKKKHGFERPHLFSDQPGGICPRP